MKMTIIIKINEGLVYDPPLAEIKAALDECLFDNFGIALAQIEEGDEE
jgi:hypothetical protein